MTSGRKQILDFPSQAWWNEHVLVPGEQPRYFKQGYYEYYLQKYLLARHFAPTSICEIGVRWGYSAFAFLSANPQAAYHGYDLQSADHGGVATPTFERVAELLTEYFPDARITLTRADTRQLTVLDGWHDFIHVDANHREDACYHDIQLAWYTCMPDGVILIDDDIKIAGVRRAAERFVTTYVTPIAYWFRQPSLTGEFVIRKGQP